MIMILWPPQRFGSIDVKDNPSENSPLNDAQKREAARHARVIRAPTLTSSSADDLWQYYDIADFDFSPYLFVSQGYITLNGGVPAGGPSTNSIIRTMTIPRAKGSTALPDRWLFYWSSCPLEGSGNPRILFASTVPALGISFRKETPTGETLSLWAMAKMTSISVASS